jgi:uncharacterized protein (DUF305 family)
MKRIRITALAAPLAVCAVLASAPGLAQQSQGTQPMQGAPAGQGMMQGHDMMQRDMPNAPGTRAMMGAMQKMNQDMMAMPMTGDADRDFAMMMRSHHQAAVDMARAEVEHGKDPELKKMARKVISDQEKEIRDLSKWLDRHPPQAAQR